MRFKRWISMFLLSAMIFGGGCGGNQTENSKPGNKEKTTLIFEIDDAILYYEFISLFGERIFDYVPQLASTPRFEYIEFLKIENEFIDLFDQLSK